MVLTCQQTIRHSHDKETPMSKNPQKKCHRNSIVSMTRLSNNTITLMNLAGLSCPLSIVPSSPWVYAICLFQTQRRAAVMEEHIYFSHAVTHYYCTLLPTQSSGFFSTPYPTLLHLASLGRKGTICLVTIPYL